MLSLNVESAWVGVFYVLFVCQCFGDKACTNAKYKEKKLNKH